MKLGLAEKICKEAILPELLLTLDHKRLSDEDVILHCTPSPNGKFEKAVLARVDKIMKSRDDANRINEISYFKAVRCRIIMLAFKTCSGS